MGSRSPRIFMSRLACRARSVRLPVRVPSVCLRGGVIALVSIVAAGGLASVQAMELASPGLLGAPANNPSNGPATNRDGTVVAFYSDASNLVASDANRVRDVFLRDLNADTTQLISLNSAGEQANGPSHSNGLSPAVSANGQLV